MTNKQVVRELIELTGSIKLEFDDLIVRMSPHSHPIHIDAVSYDYKTVYAIINGEMKEWDQLTDPVKNTIAQRLRILVITK